METTEQTITCWCNRCLGNFEAEPEDGEDIVTLGKRLYEDGIECPLCRESDRVSIRG